MILLDAGAAPDPHLLAAAILGALAASVAVALLATRRLRRSHPPIADADMARALRVIRLADDGERVVVRVDWLTRTVEDHGVRLAALERKPAAPAPRLHPLDDTGPHERADDGPPNSRRHR